MDIKKSKSWKPKSKLQLGTIVLESKKSNYSIDFKVYEQDSLQDDVLLDKDLEIDTSQSNKTYQGKKIK
jgi:hypothetical protein